MKLGEPHGPFVEGVARPALRDGDLRHPPGSAVVTVHALHDNPAEGNQLLVLEMDASGPRPVRARTHRGMPRRQPGQRLRRTARRAGAESALGNAAIQLSTSLARHRTLRLVGRTGFGNVLSSRSRS